MLTVETYYGPAVADQQRPVRCHLFGHKELPPAQDLISDSVEENWSGEGHLMELIDPFLFSFQLCELGYFSF